MARIQCANCGETWDLAAATTNRCPQCQWITEVYFSETEVQRVARIYNRADRLNARREALALYGAWLDDLLGESNVVPLRAEETSL